MNTVEDGSERRPAETSAEESVRAGRNMEQLGAREVEALPGITVGSLVQPMKAYVIPEQPGTARNTSSNAEQSGNAWESLG